MIKPLTAIFRKPSAVMLARQELEDAERSLLQAQSATEYARSLTAYHEQRIKRLGAFLKAAHTEQERDEKNITTPIA